MSYSSKLIESKEGLVGNLYLTVRSTGDNLGLWLVPGGGLGVRGLQSCRTKPLTCGICCYLWVDSVRIELNWGAPALCQRIACWCVEPPPIHTLELSTEPLPPHSKCFPSQFPPWYFVDLKTLSTVYLIIKLSAAMSASRRLPLIFHHIFDTGSST